MWGETWSVGAALRLGGEGIGVGESHRGDGEKG